MLPAEISRDRAGRREHSQQQAQRHAGEHQQPQTPAHPLPHPVRPVGAGVLGHKDGQGCGAAVPEGQKQIFNAGGRRVGGDGSGAHGIDGALDQQFAAVEAGLLQGGEGAVLGGLGEEPPLEHQVVMGQP